MKQFGILMPLSALPAKNGIGDFGDSSIRFLKWLSQKGFTYWQVLPLNPIGPGNSPYMSVCSKAIDYRYISLYSLFRGGLIKKPGEYRKSRKRVDFDKVGAYKEKYLRKAYRAFVAKGNYYRLSRFAKDNDWVSDYAAFCSLSQVNHGRPWNEWKEEDRDFCLKETVDPGSLPDYWYTVFVQYVAYRQWNRVHEKATSLGISIIGDIPFYCGYGSIECWKRRDLFDLDADYVPRTVGGFPSVAPDDDGQVWGTPCYDFDKMDADGYKFLSSRIGGLYSLYDVVRLDHFLGFNAYFSIPYGDANARKGHWNDGPQEKFFDKFFSYYPHGRLLAEDLGILTPRAAKLRDHYKLPGINLPQYSTFDSTFRDNGNLAVYLSTHDSDTFYGWFLNQDGEHRAILKEKMGLEDPDDFLSVLRYVLSIRSCFTIMTMADYLGLDNRARINYPGTSGSQNWEWRLKELPKGKPNAVSRTIDSILG